MGWLLLNVMGWLLLKTGAAMRKSPDPDRDEVISTNYFVQPLSGQAMGK